MSVEPAAEQPAEVWRRVRDELRSSVPEPTFKLWLEPLRAVSTRGTTLYLAAPEPVRRWVERRYFEPLLAAVRRHGEGLEAVGFVTEEGNDSGESDALSSLPVEQRHTFDRFVIGPGNRLAHASALAVAELPGEAYNPLFLHGPPGLGKTHLLGAIANYMRRQHPRLTVHYTTAERFTTEFVAALRHSGPAAFKARYRGLDALLIDDVQVLEGKERTEEEFVHTFNALYAAGKQIVLSSDRPPEALSRLAQRLRDRFGWGLTVELEPPDLRTRMALLWRIASASAVDLPEPATLREIADRAPGNVRRLEGAMTRVLAVASLLSEPLSPRLVRRALDDERGEHPDSASGVPCSVTLEGIQDAVCATHGITRPELLSSQRTPRIAHARQVAMYLARELTPLSLTAIAREFNRDHTTVMHAVRAVSSRLEPGSDTATTIHRIRSSLGREAFTRSGDPSPIHTRPRRPQP